MNPQIGRRVSLLGDATLLKGAFSFMQPLWSIFVRFFRIGAFTIGGGIVMLGIIESEVRATGKFSDEDIADMIVLATAVPGPMATNLSFVAGKALGGWPGACVAVLGTSLPAFLSILLLSSLILNHLSNPWLVAFFTGASAGVIVVVWNSLWKMIRASVFVGTFQILSFAATAALLIAGDLHPFLALGGGTLVSAAGGRLKSLFDPGTRSGS